MFCPYIAVPASSSSFGHCALATVPFAQREGDPECLWSQALETTICERPEEMTCWAQMRVGSTYVVPTVLSQQEEMLLSSCNRQTDKLRNKFFPLKYYPRANAISFTAISSTAHIC